MLKILTIFVGMKIINNDKTEARLIHFMNALRMMCVIDLSDYQIRLEISNYLEIFHILEEVGHNKTPEEILVRCKEVLKNNEEKVLIVNYILREYTTLSYNEISKLTGMSCKSTVGLHYKKVRQLLMGVNYISKMVEND